MNKNDNITNITNNDNNNKKDDNSNDDENKSRYNNRNLWDEQ